MQEIALSENKLRAFVAMSPTVSYCLPWGMVIMAKTRCQLLVIYRGDNSISFLLALQALQNYFDNTWILAESLFAGLQGEEAFRCPPAHGLRHPLIFYYGHVAALYVNKLRAAGIVQVRGLGPTGLAGIEESARYK